MIEILPDHIYIIRRKFDQTDPEFPELFIESFKVSETLTQPYTLLEVQHSESESIREAIADAQFNGYENIFISFDDIDFVGFYNSRKPVLPEAMQKDWGIMQFGKQQTKEGINKFVGCIGIRSSIYTELRELLKNKTMLEIVCEEEIKTISI